MANLEKINQRRVVVSWLITWLTISLYAKSGVSSSINRKNNWPFIISAPVESYQVLREMSARLSFEQYIKTRSEFFEDEQSRSLGSKLKLNEREHLANELFQTLKRNEMEAGFWDPQKYLAGKHFFRALKDFKKSNVFQLIKKMPKGGVLHAHDTALVSIDFVMSLTYWECLWQWVDPASMEISFKFSRVEPPQMSGERWTLVALERAKRGAVMYDTELRKHFTLYTENPEVDYLDINDVWNRFIGIFIRITPMLTYLPVWKAYYKQALKEFLEDGVQYLEFRGTLPDLYDLDGNIYKHDKVVQAYVDTLEEFRAENPDFIGSKIVYAPIRKVDDITFKEYMQIVMELKTKYPKFIAGFDIVSQEDLGRPLLDFAEYLLKLPHNINFYFHAGETNWNGMSSDENLIDAVLLGTKRIGHGFAILKHPKVLEAVKSNSIAIELNPISNQVLKLVADHRNHPGADLFAQDYPVVVSSDDPSFWEASPLSHDFYIAFMAIASAHADLRTLKQLVINSFAYSSMEPAEKDVAFKKWQMKWDAYIEWVIKERSKYDM